MRNAHAERLRFLLPSQGARGAAGGIATLTLVGLGLPGTLPPQLRELRTATAISLAGNALTSTIPACWGQNVTWSVGPSTRGFDAVTGLFLHLNRLTGALPTALGLIGPGAASTSVSLWDNSLRGTLPASLASLSAVALAYNPALFGPLPPGVTVQTPSALPAGSGASSSDRLFATSVGLDRPMTDILTAIRLQLDPTSRVLTWGGSNPCMPWSGGSVDQQVRAAPPRPAPAMASGLISPRSAPRPQPQVTSPSFGQGWSGVSCRDAYATSREGGVSSLWISFYSSNATSPLTGLMPVELRELRTAASIVITGHALTGTLPACWGQNYTRSFYPQSAGFDSATTLALSNNGALTGALPASLGSGMPAGATILLNNNPGIVSPLPSSLAGKTVVIAGSQGIYGAVPAGVTVAAGTSYDGRVRLLNGTSIGMASDMRSALLAIRAGLDTGRALVNWTAATHPCQWPGVVCGDAATGGGGVTALLLDSRRAGGSLCLRLARFSIAKIFPAAEPRLIVLSAAERRSLAGSIPCDILRLTSLRTLRLPSNQLTGSIPDLTQLANLTMIRLNSNLLQGPVPAAYGLSSFKGNLSLFANAAVRADAQPASPSPSTLLLAIHWGRRPQ